MLSDEYGDIENFGTVASPSTQIKKQSSMKGIAMATTPNIRTAKISLPFNESSE